MNQNPPITRQELDSFIDRCSTWFELLPENDSHPVVFRLARLIPLLYELKSAAFPPETYSPMAGRIDEHRPGRYRTLIVVEYSDFNAHEIVVLIPAWHPALGVKLDWDETPDNIKDLIYAGYTRFHASVALSAITSEDLKPDSWEEN